VQRTISRLLKYEKNHRVFEYVFLLFFTAAASQRVKQILTNTIVCLNALLLLSHLSFLAFCAIAAWPPASSRTCILILQVASKRDFSQQNTSVECARFARIIYSEVTYLSVLRSFIKLK
jgi:hypothetical protein